MQYIGIDMSKDTFRACFDESTILIFNNNPVGIRQFLKQLSPKALIGVEATGVYHLLFAHIVSEKGLQVTVINPLLTHRQIQTSLRKVKTDRTDAVAIRKALMTGLGYVFVDTVESLALKTIVSERESLVKMRAETKQRIHVHKLKQQAVTEKIFNPYTPVIKALSTQIKLLEKQMKGFEKDTQALLQSIPGVGPVTAASLVACIGNISRFNAPEKLTAYIGLDPRVYQSGTSINGKGYISKRGNASLRCILFNAAFIARRHIPELKQFFNKKISEGKHYFSAQVAVERKLVHLIYAVWTRNTPYQER